MDKPQAKSQGAPLHGRNQVGGSSTVFHPDNHRPSIQPGDILIVGGRNNAFRGGHSHTVMVEHFDETNFTITTIEGNAEDSVFSNSIDLTNADDVSKIITLVRMGAQHFGTTATTPATPTPPVADVDRITRYGLMTPIQAVITRLVEFSSAPERLWICSNNARGTVNEWINGPLCNQPQQTTGSTH